MEVVMSKRDNYEAKTEELLTPIVEQYGGIYSFARQQDQFVLRISL